MIKNNEKIKNDFKEKYYSNNFSKKLLGQIVFAIFTKKGLVRNKKNENGIPEMGFWVKTFLQDLYNNYKNKNIKAKNFLMIVNLYL